MRLRFFTVVIHDEVLLLPCYGAVQRSAARVQAECEPHLLSAEFQTNAFDISNPRNTSAFASSTWALVTLRKERHTQQSVDPLLARYTHSASTQLAEVSGFWDIKPHAARKGAVENLNENCSAVFGR